MYNYYIKLADARLAIMDYIGEQTDCKLVRDGAEGAMNALDYLTPADVVPKSESLHLDVHEVLKQRAVEKAKADVAREIFEEIERYAELNLESLDIAENVKPRAKEFFGGGKQAFSLLLDKLSELKKKYTEGEPNG